MVVFAFDPFDLDVSNFVASIPSAPILMSQCLEWLGAATSPIQPDLIKTGEPVKIRLDRSSKVERVTVQMPDGALQELQTRGSRIVFTDTTQIGVYTVFVDDEPFGRFAANLLNPQESDLSPPQLADAPNAGMDTGRVQSDLPEVNREIWGYAAFLALLLLIVEWWVYHQNRRFRQP